jgi:hypothetical protein
MNMDVQYITQIAIPQAQEMLGWTQVLFKWQEIILKPNTSIELSADNEYLFLVRHTGIVTLESALGRYTNAGLDNTYENDFEHRGQISIENHSPVEAKMYFIRMFPNPKRAWQTINE